MGTPTVGDDVYAASQVGAGSDPLMIIGIVAMLVVVLVIICTDVGARRPSRPAPE